YLMMCKEVLPKGLIGLMLGGMVFATASSVNTTLNLAAAVFTNDLYKSVRPNTKPKQLMFVAKTAVIIFGIITILVALVVPAAGGIVEIVLSVGAVTGCSLYGPPIWALFSKYHSGRSILWCTILGLSINVYFKFLSPYLTGFSFSRSEEMLAGALVPFVLLLGYEIWARSTKKVSADYLRYKNLPVEEEMNEDDKESSNVQNRHGLKVLSLAMGGIGIILILLGAISTEARLIISIGLIILLLAVYLFRQSRRKEVK